MMSLFNEGTIRLVLTIIVIIVLAIIIVRFRDPNDKK